MVRDPRGHSAGVGSAEITLYFILKPALMRLSISLLLRLRAMRRLSLRLKM